MNEILVIVAAYGMCFGLMNDKVQFLTDALQKIPLFRDDEGKTFFTRMFECPYCTGFHTGWISWALFILPGKGGFSPLDVWEAFLFAFASSAFSYGVDTAIARLER